MSQSSTPWWQLSPVDVCYNLNTDATTGLAQGEVARRQLHYGANRLPEQSSFSSLRLIVRQFTSVLVWVLLGALGIALAMGDFFNAASIALIVILNAILGFVQEYKAEHALRALRTMLVPASRVMREGLLQAIASTALVPGDIVLLEAGDVVPADGRLLQAVQLMVHEATLTGESEPVIKTAASIDLASVPVADRSNMVFTGTHVVKGKGSFIVTETGQFTLLGAIATSLNKDAIEPSAPLQRDLDGFGRRLAVVLLIVVALIFAVSLMRGSAMILALMTAISLAVAAIPEGLPAVTTVTLALGVRRMARLRALVRWLPAVETLGCTTVICTDKTGTLTKNEMTVRALWVDQITVDVTGTGYAPEGQFVLQGNVVDPVRVPTLRWALEIGALCNDAALSSVGNRWEVVGDPTEGALITVALKAGIHNTLLAQCNPLVYEIPFDGVRKRMTCVRDTAQGRVVMMKGAADVVLRHATMFEYNGQQVPLTQALRQQIMEAHDTFAGQAMRVLAVAYRQVANGIALDEHIEQEMIFVGLIAMIDPPRPEVKQAVQTCMRAGITPVMITGDHKQTALAIAREIGLLQEGFVAIEGTELDAMSDENLMRDVRKIAVYARVTPEHKLRIVRAWQQVGEVVAVTGDGVNDAPAIKAADIGIAMGVTGTEVAKEAADMVILDDNFATIVCAVREGRGVYDNIVKFINYLITANIAEILLIAIAVVFGGFFTGGGAFVALLPIHLLWINVITDGLPALALGVDPADPMIMDRKPRSASQAIVSLTTGVSWLAMSLLLAIGALCACWYGRLISVAHGQTMAVTTLVVLEFVRLYVIRRCYNIGLLSNRWLIGALAVSFGLHVAVVYVEPLRQLFQMVALGLGDWLMIFGIAVLVAVVSISAQGVWRWLRHVWGLIKD